ncbi:MULTISPECIES: hydroxyisourate hydrolase [unclassified Acinetobacter]|uniref:hydroxyisourate hydrolase n=1 Tax=unclassified Acinetobacter TaxID=196816 RepID=UPI002934FDEC|nr:MULTISPECIES: hydroxyisourate hydrolase [unclassified Acinetobacter]WOE32567.1 hydroxyisourate hydrolase [Acinetobacter sp. SAAs470]WOE38042.1 hydroxyisourate hydrolase [Acinetobacter sp. SAAs474]
MLKKFLPLSTLLMTSMLFAQDNPLSVHVLNLENGLPSANVEVVLEQQTTKGWVKLNQKMTGENGRITALYPENKALAQGIYKVTFKTEDWFRKHNQTTFFPEVPVIFKIDGEVKHYHIPLLLSPYGYSTYRGN